MADATTVNYGWAYPTVNADADTWGTTLNNAIIAIDSTVKQLAKAQNRLINGDFGINQLGVSGSVVLAAGAYGHDGWKAGASGCTYTFSGGVVTVSSGTLLQQIAAANMEGGDFIASQAGTAQIRIYQGSPSGAYADSPVPKTGLSASTNTYVEFGTGTITKAQLESGAIANAFERISQEESLARCQPYCQVVGGTTFGAVGVGSALSATVASILFSARKTFHGIPTATLVGNAILNDGVNTTVITSLSVNGAASTADAITLTCNVASGLTAFRPYALQANNDSTMRLILEARL